MAVDRRIEVTRGDAMPPNIISIAPAPIPTLWAAVVAERLGSDEDEALTLAKTLAGLNAQIT
jgi:hypothetical protein